MIKNKLFDWREPNNNSPFEKTIVDPVYQAGASENTRLPTLIRFRADMKKAGVLLPLYLLLNGCLAPPIIPPDSELQKISTLLIVPVESPPLEIIPDPVEDRIPAYRHFTNMSISLPPLQEKIYRNKAGVVIAGRVGQDDTVQEISRDTPMANSLSSLGSIEQNWMPTLVLARQAVSQLDKLKTKAMLSDRFYRLPITNDNVNAHLKDWHDAISDWYSLNHATVDYQQLGPDSVDAVLEIGIGNYRVFEKQISLQVFIKLINPKTGQVLARTREQNFIVGDEAQSLFNYDSEPFKQLITDMGTNLLLDGFREVELIHNDSLITKIN
jgi:hypothetical protein